MSSPGRIRRRAYARASVVIFGFFVSSLALGQAIPQKNVNVIGPTPPNLWYAGDTFMQFNEADGACSPNNPLWCAIGMNDYSGVNNPALGDAYQGISMTRDGGATWIRGLHPGHLLDASSINQQFAADPNLEAVPGMLYFNYIAGWRDGSQPGGVYLGRWYERNTEAGPPWQFLDNRQVDLGTPGRFLDKPGYKVAYGPPDAPSVTVAIPALPNPDPGAGPGAALLHDAFTLEMPAHRMHLCFAIFVGNDNNDGTKIECTYSDDAGETWSGRTKLTESTDINQGVSIATRNFGQDVLACWLRFRDNNDDNSLLCAFSNDGAESFSKPVTVTDFCPLNQPTGPARHRTNALPVVTSNGSEFAVYFASRNLPVKNGENRCVIPGNGSSDPVPLMSNVALIDDFDSFGETPDPVTGARVRDGLVRTSRNFTRILMTRATNPGNPNGWSNPVAIDPQTRSDVPECQGPGVSCRRNFHQYMPATFTADGTEVVAYYDSRLDRLNQLSNPITSGFIGDVIVNLQSETCDPETGLCTPPWTEATLLPAEVYELEPPPPEVPAPGNNIALRRNIDVFAAQIVNGTPRPYLVDPETFYPDADVSNAISSPSVRVTRFTTQVKRDSSGNAVTDPDTGLPVREQVQFNFPNARMFQKGTRPFIGDYNTVFAVNARKVGGVWTSNQDALPTTPGEDVFFASREPTFHVGWTSNRDVRGKVFYTGCDVWNEAEQRWEAGDGVACNSDYVTPAAPPAPTGAMAPLQGEDGSQDGPPGACSVELGTISNLLSSYSGPLTRNQKIYTARLLPGLNVEVVSAVKSRLDSDNPDAGVPLNTFVIAMQNGSPFARRVRLEIGAGETGVSFERRTFIADEGEPLSDPLEYIDVVIPAGSSNFRTLFDAAGDLLEDVIVVEAYDVTDIGIFDADGQPLPDSDPGTGDLVARLALDRGSAAPLEQLATIDPETGLPIDVTDEDFFRLLLERETTASKTLEFQNLEYENLEFQNLEFQNLAKLLEFENSAELLEFQNLEFQNTLLFVDFENLEFQNILVDNSTLTEDSYSVLDLNAATLAQLEFENTSVELLEFQNLEFQNLEFENRTLAEDIEFLEFENTFLEMLEFQNTSGEFLEFENLEFQNLEFQNDSFDFTSTEFLEFQNANTENLEFQNSPVYDSAIDNPDLGYITIDQSLVGSESVEMSWAASSLSNNAVGTDAKPIFSPPLVEALEASGTQVILSVREIYLRPTVALTASEATGSFCSVQIVAENQVVYSAVLTPSQINTLFDDPEASDAYAPAFRLDPYAKKIITLQFIAPPPQFDSAEALADDVGMAIFAQGAQGDLLCEENSEAQDEVFAACEIDLPVNFDETPPVLTLNGDNPQVIEATLDGYDDPGATAIDDTDGDISGAIVVTGTVDAATAGTYELTYTVQDAAGNEAVVVRTVTVVDTTSPVLDFPPVTSETPPFVVDVDRNTFTLDWEFGVTDADSTLDVSCDVSAVGDPSTTAATLTPLATDPLFEFTYDFEVGQTTVTCRAEDSSGNVGEGTFVVEVFDETPPLIEAVADPLVVTTQALEAEVDILGNVTATDVVNGSLTPSCTLDAGEAGDPRDVDGPVTLPIGTIATASCSVTDSSGNESTIEFGVEVRFALGIRIAAPKGNIRAGSSVPIDWFYLDPVSGQPVDSSTIVPMVEWFGAFPSQGGCSGTSGGSNDGSTAADDAGNSSFRYSRSDRRWRLNWATPAAAGYYRVVITPPNSEEGTICVRLR